MTREEAKKVFLNRGYVEVDGGTIYDADKWRQSCIVISEWLIEQEPLEVETIELQKAYNKGFETCRQAALDIVDRYSESQSNVEDVTQDIISDIMVLPSANLQEPCDVFDEYSNYKFPSDVELTKPNTATSMPCEDAISRQAVMDALCNDCELFRNGEQTCFTKCEEYHFLATLPLPPVTPQQKIGHWIQTNEFFINQDGQFIYKFICSECKSLSYFRTSNKKAIGANVCPNCGARMV